MLSNFFWIQFLLTVVQDSIWLLICSKTATKQNHLEYTQWWKALWHCDFQLSFSHLHFLEFYLSNEGVQFFCWVRQLREGSPLFYNFVAYGMNQIHHADFSISFWCLLFHINYFRCAQSSDNIKTVFIYETVRQWPNDRDALYGVLIHFRWLLGFWWLRSILLLQIGAVRQLMSQLHCFSGVRGLFSHYSSVRWALSAQGSAFCVMQDRHTIWFGMSAFNFS